MPLKQTLLTIRKKLNSKHREIILSFFKTVCKVANKWLTTRGIVGYHRIKLEVCSVEQVPPLWEASLTGTALAQAL
jgi:hypothetical protein